MPNLTSVGVTAGVPTSGTGTVSTIDALLAVVPSALGSTGAASSLATTLSTEDVARVGSVTETAPASDTASSGLNGRLQRIAQRITALMGTAGTAATNVLSIQGIASMVPVNTKERFFATVFSTLTRPANTTAYTANDSISDNATAGSVTALSATVSDTNDDPICLERIRVVSTDTGLANKNVRVWLFNSDPTASTGVGAGDNAAYSNKMAGFVGTMSGTFRAMSDGSVACLVPDEGSRIICNPSTGAKLIYIQFQTLSDFTPSANSTTLIARAEGFQGRA